jgi:hypothetical protein
MEKVYILWWTNGEPYRENVERRILKVFSTLESAESCAKKWRSDYKKECDEINEGRKSRGYGDMDFSEEVWMHEYDLHN